MKRFTPLFILCFMTFPFLHSCVISNWKEVKGNYQIISKTLSISDYDEILLSLPADVIYRQIPQEKPFLQVTVDENIFPLLDISVQGKRLVITQNSDSTLHPSQLVIYTNSKDLNKINITGSGDIRLENAVNTGNMEIAVVGSGDVKADSLYCENLNVKITGSGDIILKGAAGKAAYSIAGSGDIDALDYLVQELDCRVSGSGDIKAYVYNQLKASISGSGDIRYKGNPESVDTQVAGSGEINKIN
jgi:hypothetical protein